MNQLLRDPMGLSFSSGSRSSIDRYHEALQLLHAYIGNPVAVIDSALAEQPDFLAGHAMRAALMFSGSDKRALPEMRRSVEAAEALIASGGGNDRERGHIAAARAWLNQDFERAADLYNRLALEYPRDGLAVQISHAACNFFLGRATWLRDHAAAVIPQLSPSEPLYGFAHGMYAFGLEECGEYERAEAAGMRALECNRRDPWAVHAVAHTYEMRGHVSRGIKWLRDREQDWAPESFFAIHNYWHLALFLLELHDFDGVLAIYDQKVRGMTSELCLELVDASALLWRLQLAGVNVKDRWTDLAAIWRKVEEHGYYGWNDWHALMAYAGSGAHDDVARTIERLQPNQTTILLANDVTLRVCTAFARFATGDYGAVVDGLFGVRPFAARFGGSHAQRDILDLTLIEAALRDQQFSLARSLASARAERKSESPGPLRYLARGYAGAGAVESAGAASEQVEKLAAMQRAAAAAA